MGPNPPPSLLLYDYILFEAKPSGAHHLKAIDLAVDPQQAILLDVEPTLAVLHHRLLKAVELAVFDNEVLKLFSAFSKGGLYLVVKALEELRGLNSKYREAGEEQG